MMALTITITLKTYDAGTPNEETVKIAEVRDDGKQLKEIFSYPSTMSDADIQADVIAKMQERGYI